MNNKKFKVVSICFSFFMMIGALSQSTMCLGWFYKPAYPDELQDKKI